jgi:hypothetical protein
MSFDLKSLPQSLQVAIEAEIERRVSERLAKRGRKMFPVEKTVEVLQACLRYDPDTGILFWRERPRDHFRSNLGWAKFQSTHAGKPAGTIGGATKYVWIRIGSKRWSAHTAAWIIMTSDLVPEGMVIDHKDGNAGNNRWDNLRLATWQQNRWNSRRARQDRELPKNVRLTRWGTYQSCVKKDYKHYYNGTFENLEDAVEASAALRARLHGEYENSQ